MKDVDGAILDEIALLRDNYYMKYGKEPDVLVSNLEDTLEFETVFGIKIYNVHPVGGKRDLILVGCTKSHMFPNAILGNDPIGIHAKVAKLTSNSAMPFVGYVTIDDSPLLFLHLDY
ncbi:hypothetical protein EalM132_00036 [Exiguobacterium phage vB_EalM-132]|nr:hypothetical protein EalM132_00036 [Exiguobacterium phage vB_EalM-132]